MGTLHHPTSIQYVTMDGAAYPVLAMTENTQVCDALPPNSLPLCITLDCDCFTSNSSHSGMIASSANASHGSTQMYVLRYVAQQTSCFETRLIQCVVCRLRGCIRVLPLPMARSLVVEALLESSRRTIIANGSLCLVGIVVSNMRYINQPEPSKPIRVRALSLSLSLTVKQ
jgi:hypothetical protein